MAIWKLSSEANTLDSESIAGVRRSELNSNLDMSSEQVGKCGEWKKACPERKGGGWRRGNDGGG
jgi:hypothetical protein